IPGIGRKTAQRVVLELKEKLASASGAPETNGAVGQSSHLVAPQALVELGYSLVEAEQALASIDPELPVEERVKRALRGRAA
ncbi:MAG: Holliday junction branch migration protein RuvA, partial [Gaiellaceae bacterium]